jgi:hypothetical protein
VTACHSCKVSFKVHVRRVSIFWSNTVHSHFN